MHFLKAHKKFAQAVAFSPDGMKAEAAGDKGSRVVVWDVD